MKAAEKDLVHDIASKINFFYRGDLSLLVNELNLALEKEGEVTKNINVERLQSQGFYFSGDLSLLVEQVLFFSSEKDLITVEEQNILSESVTKENPLKEPVSDIEPEIEIVIPISHGESRQCVEAIVKNTSKRYRLTLAMNRAVYDNVKGTDFIKEANLVICEKENYVPLLFNAAIKSLLAEDKFNLRSVIIFVNEHVEVKFGWENSLIDLLVDRKGLATYSKFAGSALDLKEIPFKVVAIKREVLQEIGLLNPNYLEVFFDTAYCMRAYDFGWEIAISDLDVIDTFHISRNDEQLKIIEAADRDRFCKQFSSVGWLPRNKDFLSTLDIAEPIKEIKLAYNGDMISLEDPLPVVKHPNIGNVYFYMEEKIFNPTRQDFQSWFKQIEAVLSYCKGKGIDVGSGGRTLSKEIFRVDKSEAVAPHLIWDSSTLPMFADNSADFIFSNQHLEHIENTLQALQEWVRVVKPGGYVNIITIDRDAYGAVGSKNTDLDHKFCWTKQEFQEMIQAWVTNGDLKVTVERKFDLGSDYGVTLKVI